MSVFQYDGISKGLFNVSSVLVLVILPRSALEISFVQHVLFKSMKESVPAL